MSESRIPAKNDLRIRYTRHVLKSSLVSLLEQKPLEKIKVTELCAKAEINRSTFYTHYVDLFDLMDKIKEEIKAEILEHMIDHYSAEPELFMESTIHFLNYLKDNANLYLHLYNETDSNCLREQMWQKTKDMHLKQGGHPDMYAEFRLRFKTFGITSVINDWVGNKKNVPAEDIAGLIIKFSGITL